METRDPCHEYNFEYDGWRWNNGPGRLRTTGVGVLAVRGRRLRVRIHHVRVHISPPSSQSAVDFDKGEAGLVLVDDTSRPTERTGANTHKQWMRKIKEDTNRIASSGNHPGFTNAVGPNNRVPSADNPSVGFSLRVAVNMDTVGAGSQLDVRRGWSTGVRVIVGSLPFGRSNRLRWLVFGFRSE